MSSAQRVRDHRERSRAAGRDRYEVRGDRADADLVRAVAAALAERRVSHADVERLLKPSSTEREPVRTWAEWIVLMREIAGPEGYEWPERRRDPPRYAEFD